MFGIIEILEVTKERPESVRYNDTGEETRHLLFGCECHTRLDVGLETLDSLIDELLLIVVGRGQYVVSLFSTIWL